MATSREMKRWSLTLGGAVLILAASLYILGVEDSSSAPAGRARQLAGG